MELFYCEHCKNIITKLEDSGVPVMCCGAKMQKIEPNTVDAAKEKHVPKYEVVGGAVNVVVGDVIHPMQEDHYIKWIIVKTCQNVYVKFLKYTDEPKATFKLNDDETVLEVYEYCNKHGVWKA